MKPEDGIYFVTARSGKAKGSGNDYGVVELVTVDGGQAQTQTVFCEPAVAVRAASNFKVFDRVDPVLETRLTSRGPRAELVELVAV